MRYAILLLFCISVIAGCSPASKVSAAPVTDPEAPPTTPFDKSLTGKWILTDTQTAGIGPPGIWSKASPAGQTLELLTNSNVTGTAFPAATTYQLLDSMTIKLIDKNQSAGFRLFSYRIDTMARALFFYIRLPNGAACIEGCGTYKFSR